MNNHIIVGPDNKCLCGMYLNRTVSCQQLIDGLELIKEQDEAVRAMFNNEDRDTPGRANIKLFFAVMRSMIVDLDAIKSAAPNPEGPLDAMERSAESWLNEIVDECEKSVSEDDFRWALYDETFKLANRLKERLLGCQPKRTEAHQKALDELYAQWGVGPYIHQRKAFWLSFRPGLYWANSDSEEVLLQENSWLVDCFPGYFNAV